MLQRYFLHWESVLIQLKVCLLWNILRKSPRTTKTAKKHPAQYPPIKGTLGNNFANEPDRPLFDKNISPLVVINFLVMSALLLVSWISVILFNSVRTHLLRFLHRSRDMICDRRVSYTMFFGSLTRDENRDTTSFAKYFGKPDFPKHRRSQTKTILAMWDKNVRQKLLCPFALSKNVKQTKKSKIFRKPKFPKISR